MNNVTLVGRLTKDVELRYTGSQTQEENMQELQAKVTQAHVEIIDREAYLLDWYKNPGGENDQN